jgi:hypothetical protein
MHSVVKNRVLNMYQQNLLILIYILSPPQKEFEENTVIEHRIVL